MRKPPSRLRRNPPPRLYALGTQSMGYAIIPGGSALRLALGLDDYAAVKNAFNLPD